MFFLCLLISYFVNNEFTVDDLGFLITMMGVTTLILVVTFRAAAVRSFIQ
jgi:hypothetical protein